MTDTRPSVTVLGQSPGWWPNLVDLECSGCGHRWTVDLNKATWTAEAFLRREQNAHEMSCESRKGS